jgi:hypothetical protein
MINAVLVFNNSGQPRLTKFYTQRVCSPLLTLPHRNETNSFTEIQIIGNKRPTTPHLRNLHPRLPPYPRLLQLPTPPAHSLFAVNTLPQRQHQFPNIRRTSALQRRPLSNNLPALRNALFHHHLYIHRVPPRAHRLNTSICRSARSALRRRMRARPHFQL